MSRDLLVPPPIYRWYGGPLDGAERTLPEFAESWVVPIVEGVAAGALLGHAGPPHCDARTPGASWEHVYTIRRDHMAIPDTFRHFYKFDYIGQQHVDDRRLTS